MTCQHCDKPIHKAMFGYKHDDRMYGCYLGVKYLGTQASPDLGKCGCSTSTGICGSITRGTGRLDFNGYWERPCPHGNDMVLHEDDFREVAR